MKVMMFALMLMVATSALAVPFAVDDPADLSGAWVVNIQTEQAVITSDAVLTTDGLHVFGTLSSPSGDLKVFGSFDSESVHLYAESADGPVVLVFTGARTPGKISGTATFDGVGDVTWTAARK